VRITPHLHRGIIFVKLSELTLCDAQRVSCDALYIQKLTGITPIVLIPLWEHCLTLWYLWWKKRVMMCGSSVSLSSSMLDRIIRGTKDRYIMVYYTTALELKDCVEVVLRTHCDTTSSFCVQLMQHSDKIGNVMSNVISLYDLLDGSKNIDILLSSLQDDLEKRIKTQEILHQNLIDVYRLRHARIFDNTVGDKKIQ
jgi:hypothetical protein